MTLLFQTAAAQAIDFERLMMPGPVSRAHAEYEDDCAKCHSPFESGREEALCIVCHEDEGSDRKTDRGFHGRDPGASKLACRSCHTEHKGRGHDILGLNPSSFNHDHTDYPLRGTHAVTACSRCHVEDGETRRREAPSNCVDCHAKDDHHQEKLGTECGDCHEETRWTAARFDHSKTKFELRGAHERVSCDQCHPGRQYEDRPTECIGCHRLDDTHQGRFGSDCARCHDETSFKKSQRFDHTRETKFPLKGRHAEITCEQCHVEPAEKVKLAMDCRSCHAAVDAHRTLLGPKCEDCHRETRWSETTFDHAKTRFELEGQHRKASCVSCHPTQPEQARRLATCRDCHRSDDVHANQLGADCARCHGAAAWQRDVFFEHDLTRFPLLGMHAAIACDACHTTMRFRDAKRDCVKCHESDDTHEGGLGSDCAACHNPNGWSIWRFDHAAEARFALDGKHEGLACSACHEGGRGGRVNVSARCGTCHARDDVHRGRFGDRCESCHDSTAWKNTRIPR